MSSSMLMLIGVGNGVGDGDHNERFTMALAENNTTYAMALEPIRKRRSRLDGMNEALLNDAPEEDHRPTDTWVHSRWDAGASKGGR